MTGVAATELVTALDALGWSNRHLARLLGCDHKLTERWLDGTAAIPPSVLSWVRRLAAAHERNPAPTDWRVR